jgi:glycosyltransferase involved in cell wall biosynthesis
MNSLERVAIIVPAYNEEHLIRGTLASITRQVTDANLMVAIVDNGSTDNTAEIVRDYPGAILLEEPSKGTGTAANTGFNYAVAEHNPHIIMRTDADTVPDSDWVEAARHYFKKKSDKQLISGFVRPLKDEYYKLYDELALPAAYTAYRFGVSALKRTLWPLRVARGGNMAVRPHAFQEVGGFPVSSIAKGDDDIELTKNIYETFGFRALGNARDMQVRTSMRLMRHIGYHGLIQYYLNFTPKPINEVRQEMMNNDLDAR